MSREMREMVQIYRRILKERIITQRRSFRELRRIYCDDRRTLLEIATADAQEMFTIKEFVYNVELETGLPILSRTRAQWRREGKNVN